MMSYFSHNLLLLMLFTNLLRKIQPLFLLLHSLPPWFLIMLIFLFLWSLLQPQLLIWLFLIVLSLINSVNSPMIILLSRLNLSNLMLISRHSRWSRLRSRQLLTNRNFQSVILAQTLFIYVQTLLSCVMIV